jgi:hypothetical protein
MTDSGPVLAQKYYLPAPKIQGLPDFETTAGQGKIIPVLNPARVEDRTHG